MSTTDSDGEAAEETAGADNDAIRRINTMEAMQNDAIRRINTMETMQNDAIRRINTMETPLSTFSGFRPDGNAKYSGAAAEEPPKAFAYPAEYDRKYEAWLPESRSAAQTWQQDGFSAQHDEQWLQCFQALSAHNNRPSSSTASAQHQAMWAEPGFQNQHRGATSQGSSSQPAPSMRFQPQSAPSTQSQAKKGQGKGQHGQGNFRGQGQQQPQQQPQQHQQQQQQQQQMQVPMMVPPAHVPGVPPGMFPMPMPPPPGLNGMHHPMIPVMPGMMQPGMQLLGFACVPVQQEKPATADSEFHDDITLMLRNLPNKITQVKLLSRLQGYRQSIDFLYLPTDFENKCNLGYAFINFIDGASARRFQQEFNEKKLPGCRRSTKVLAVQPARVQGVSQNVRRFRNSSVMGVLTEEEKPMLFKNGAQIPFPTPDGPLPPVGPRYPRENAEPDRADA
jgi:hypothetical protein